MTVGEAGPPAPRSRRPAFLAAFAFPAYRGLWVGAFLSSLGTWTQDVALSWLIQTRYGDPRLLGLRQFTAEAPLIAFMLLGGAAADRIDRRRILLTSQVVQMTLAAVLGLLYVTGHLGIGPILAVAFLTGLAQSQSAPTYQAVLTTLVPPQHIPNAVALNSLQFNLSRALGPVLAGFLLTTVGTGPCLAVNALSFLAVIAAIWRITLPPPIQGASGQRLRDSLRDGFRHVAESPVLRALTVLAFAGSFLAFPLITFLPVVADRLLEVGALGYSALLASFGTGAIAGAVVTAHRGKVKGRGRLLLVAFAVHGLSTSCALLASRPIVCMPFLLVAGFSLVMAFSTLNSLVQEHAPDALRGRVLSIFGLAFRGGGPLGALTAGFLMKLPLDSSRAVGAAPVLMVYAVTLALIAVTFHGRNGRIPSL